jgi:hypothetical protein
MTTTAQQTDQRLQLIEDILKTILGTQIDFIQYADIQNVRFVKKWKDNPDIYRVMELSWNNNLDFVVREYSDKRWQAVTIGTSRWFRVRDLLRKKFLAAEKLKV